MAQFTNVVLTNSGKALMSKILSGETGVTFTSLKTTNHTYLYSDLENVDASAFANGGIKQSITPSEVVRVGNNQVKVSGVFGNAGVTSGYNLTAVGVYATDPNLGEILYGIAISSQNGVPDYIPPNDSISEITITFNLYITVGNSANVSLVVDPAGVATTGQLTAVQNQINTITVNYSSMLNDVNAIKNSYAKVSTSSGGAPYYAQNLNMRQTTTSSPANTDFYNAPVINGLKNQLDNADNNLQNQVTENRQLINALQGVGGYLQHNDFGTPNPTQAAINTYAASYIWGEGSFTTGDGTQATDIWTVTDDGATHTLSEIFNSTRVKNDNDNHTWELANTQGTTPPIFEWINAGFDGVGIADFDTAGLVKGAGDINVDADGNVFLKPAAKQLIRRAYANGTNFIIHLNVSSGTTTTASSIVALFDYGTTPYTKVTGSLSSQQSLVSYSGSIEGLQNVYLSTQTDYSANFSPASVIEIITDFKRGYRDLQIKHIGKGYNNCTISLVGDMVGTLFAISTDYPFGGMHLKGDIYPDNGDGTCGDGVLNASDVSLLTQALNNPSLLTAEQKKWADMNGDNVINSVDLTLLKRAFANGNVTPQPPTIVNGIYDPTLDQTDYLISGWSYQGLIYLTTQSSFSGNLDISKVKKVLTADDIQDDSFAFPLLKNGATGEVSLRIDNTLNVNENGQLHVISGGGGGSAINPYQGNFVDGVTSEIQLDYTYFGKAVYAITAEQTVPTSNTANVELISLPQADVIFDVKGYIRNADNSVLPIGQPPMNTGNQSNGFAGIALSANGTVALRMNWYTTPSGNGTARVTLFYTKKA